MLKQKCDRCEKKAVIELPYGPHWLCKEHFLRFFEKRVRKTCRTNGLVRPREKLLVACSGGKDSSVVLFMMKKIFAKANEVHALLIDEGIKGYRDKALGFAEQNCYKWKIPFTRVSFKEEFGFTMVDVMKKTGAKKKLGSTCAFCGVLRRKLLNKYAKKLKADKLVTGHNLDDEAQSILMNVCDADLARLVRLGPIAGSTQIKGLVPRIKPLWETPEIEIIAFAHYTGIRHYSEQCCPFKWQAKRNTYRAVLNHLESSFPGTMYSIQSFFRQAKPALMLLQEQGLAKKKNSGINYCVECGDPSIAKICVGCRLVKKIKQSPLKNKKKRANEKKEKGLTNAMEKLKLAEKGSGPGRN